MCPVAAESKNSNPSSKKKINKKIDSILENDKKDGEIKNNQDPIQNSFNEKGSIENNEEFNV